MTTARLLPPLRDGQAPAPSGFCPLCGGEQYRWDRPVLWRGRLICAPCLAQLEEEEDSQRYDFA